MRTQLGKLAVRPTLVFGRCRFCNAWKGNRPTSRRSDGVLGVCSGQAEYHKFQDEAAAQEKRKLESQQRALQESHLREIDQQARTAVTKIATLERQLAEARAQHVQERAESQQEIRTMQIALAERPEPEPPLVEVPGLGSW